MSSWDMASEQASERRTPLTTHYSGSRCCPTTAATNAAVRAAADQAPPHLELHLLVRGAGDDHLLALRQVQNPRHCNSDDQ